MWQRLNERQRLLAMVLAAVLAVAGFYLLVLGKQIAAFQQAATDVETVGAELRVAKTKAARLEAETEREAVSRAHLQELIQHFDTNYQDGAVLVNVGLRALQDGVFIAGLRPGEVITEQVAYLELPVELEFWGTYDGVLSLVRYLENLENLAHIKQLELDQYFLGTQLWDMFGMGVEPVVRAKLVLSFYAVPEAGKQLQQDLLRIQEWSLGRGNNAFNYPGVFAGQISPHFEVATGGEYPLLALVTPPETEPVTEFEVPPPPPENYPVPDVHWQPGPWPQPEPEQGTEPEQESF